MAIVRVCNKCGKPAAAEATKRWEVDKSDHTGICVHYCDSDGNELPYYDLCLTHLQEEIEKYAQDLLWKIGPQQNAVSQ